MQTKPNTILEDTIEEILERLECLDAKVVELEMRLDEIDRWQTRWSKMSLEESVKVARQGMISLLTEYVAV